jgi:hypothetical protein
MNALNRILFLSLLLAPSSGCLLQEVTHTLLLEPDGTVTWTVYQKDVRSDAKTPQERDREEGELWDLVQMEEHPMAAALREIGATELHTTVLRDRRPYSLVTSARFESVASMFERLLAAVGVPGQVEMREEPEGTRLVLRLMLADAEAQEDLGSSAATALLADGKDLRIVLAEGHFVEASGFKLEDGGTAATFEEVSDKDLENSGGVLTLSLTWSAAD